MPRRIKQVVPDPEATTQIVRWGTPRTQDFRGNLRRRNAVIRALGMAKIGDRYVLMHAMAGK